jgi:hypothetical protein
VGKLENFKIDEKIAHLYNYIDMVIFQLFIHTEGDISFTAAVQHPGF